MNRAKAARWRRYCGAPTVCAKRLRSTGRGKCSAMKWRRWPRSCNFPTPSSACLRAVLARMNETQNDLGRSFQLVQVLIEHIRIQTLAAQMLVVQQIGARGHIDYAPPNGIVDLLLEVFTLHIALADRLAQREQTLLDFQQQLESRFDTTDTVMLVERLIAAGADCIAHTVLLHDRLAEIAHQLVAAVIHRQSKRKGQTPQQAAHPAHRKIVVERQQRALHG